MNILTPGVKTWGDFWGHFSGKKCALWVGKYRRFCA